MSSNKTKNALITGAAKRIGRQIAISLENEGWNVCVHYNKTKPDCKTSVQGDLNNFSNIKKVFAAAQKKLGGEINLLINNASVFEKINFANTTEQVFDENFNIHVKAPFFLAQEFAKQTSNGQIINILDTNIVRNKTTYFAYLLSKKSLADLTRMLAVELAPKIRVNSVLPSSIEEYLSNLDKKYVQNRRKEIPQKEFPRYFDVIESIIFLTKSKLTGQEIYVDGGEQLI